MDADFQSIKAMLDSLLTMNANLEAKVSVLQSQVEEMDDDYQQQIPWFGEGDGGDGDFAFKITAVYDDVSELFVVNVLGGAAQTLGGEPHLYEDVEISGVNDGSYICLVYQNVDSNYVEVGEWDVDIHAWSGTDIATHVPPKELVFVIGRVSSKYSKNVRQDHKGAVIMPAISNVVDVQTQLP